MNELINVNFLWWNFPDIEYSLLAIEYIQGSVQNQPIITLGTGFAISWENFWLYYVFGTYVLAINSNLLIVAIHSHNLCTSQW